MSVEERGDALLEVIRLETQDGAEFYELNGTEMYLLHDYVKHLKDRIETEHSMVRSLANALGGVLDTVPASKPNTEERASQVFAYRLLAQVKGRFKR